MTFAAVTVPVTCPGLRALRRKAGRINISGRLAQPDDDAAVHAGLADVDMGLLSPFPAAGYKTADKNIVSPLNEGVKKPDGAAGHDRHLL